MATRIGKLNVQLSAHTRGLTRGLKRGETSIKRFTRRSKRVIEGFARAGIGRFGALAAAAGLSAAGIGYAFSNSASRIDDLTKSSRRLLGNNGATGALAGIRQAAEEAGVETATLDRGLRRMMQTLGRAKQGDVAAIRALERIGIAGEELQRLRPENALARIADGINGIAGADSKIAASSAIFGTRSGTELITLFETGGAAIRAAQGDMEKFGKSLTALEAKRVEQMNDSLGRSNLAFTGLIDQLTVRLAPIVTDLNDRFLGMVERIGGVGKAAETTFNFAIKMGSKMAGVVDSIGTAWGHLKAIMQATLTAQSKVLSVMDPIVNAFGSGRSEEELLKAFPEHRRDQARKLAAKTGGFKDEDLDFGRVSDAFDAETRDTIAGIKKRRKRTSAEKLDTKFEAYVFDATKKADTKGMETLGKAAEKRKQNEEQITKELRKQKETAEEIAQGEAGQGRLALTALNGPIAAQAQRSLMQPGGDNKPQQHGKRTNELLEQISVKLSRGIPAVYA